jgi:hypothetical protein
MKVVVALLQIARPVDGVLVGHALCPSPKNVCGQYTALFARFQAYLAIYFANCHPYNRNSHNPKGASA